MNDQLNNLTLKLPTLPDEVACTYNPATLETEFWNALYSVTFCSNNP